MSENMATKLRQRISGRSFVSKVIGYTLLAIIGIVFVFFGAVNQMGLGVGSVGRVNDTLISAADLDSQERQIQEYYSKLFGGSMDLGPQRNMLRQQAMESLIRAELSSQGARAAGLQATDDEIRAVIVREIPAFQENGIFMKSRYMAYLESVRMSPGDFESKLRKDIETLRARQIIEAAALPMTLEVAKLRELQGTKMNIQFAQVVPEAIARTGKGVSPEDARRALTSPEFVKKAEDYFQAYKSDWSEPEMVKAQHILVAFAPGSVESEQNAQQRVKLIQDRAKKEDFGRLAAEFSDDPGSKSKNGQLEPFGRGKMVKEFETAAFSQKIGEIGPPVKSQFGYHLIRVNSRTEEKTASFEAVKEDVARRILARDRVDEQMKELEKALQEGRLEQVQQGLSMLGASWQETGFFDLTGEIPKLPQGTVAKSVSELAPGKELLSRFVQDAGGSRYVLRLKEVKKEEPSSRGNMVELMQRQRAESLYGSWLEDFRADSRVEVNSQIFSQ